MNPPQSTFTMDGVWNQKYIFLCMINKSKFKLHSVKYSALSFCLQGPSGSWSLWVRTLVRYGVLDATLCDKVGHCLAAGRWFSPGTPISTTNKTHRHDITEILLKVELNTINQTYTHPAIMPIWHIQSQTKVAMDLLNRGSLWLSWRHHV
jgi:hypothetical protein